jgi:NAD(P)-dependent dehydrogenase (short-subunit alcohol dehydrogenase family)
VIVTGGASGIGAAVTTQLLARGDRVMIADLNPPKHEQSGQLLFAETDVRDPDAVQAMADLAENEFGSIDLAVLCAGIASTGGLTPETVDLAAYHRVLDINVGGVVHGIRSATPALRRAGGGTIVTLASLAGLTPAVGDPFYSLTKFAVVGLVRTLGPQLSATDGIRLAAVCPGFVDTPMVDGLRATFTANGFPLIEVEHVAETVVRIGDGEGESGDCWLIQAGYPAAPYKFRGVPGAKRGDGEVARVPSDRHAARAAFNAAQAAAAPAAGDPQAGGTA